MTTSLHVRLAEIQGELDRTREGLLSTLAQTPPDTVGLKPSTDRWSVAEIAEHLLIVENGVGRLLGKLGKQAEALGAETSDASVLPSLDRFGLKDGRRRIVSPSMVSPTGRVALADSVAGLAESRGRIIELMHGVNGRALDGLTAPHPLFGPLTFYQWLLFLALHEERHSLQIRETARRVSGQASASGH